MKKKLAIVLFTLVMIFALAFTVSAAAKKGDVNNDGVITAADARLTLRCAARLETLTDEQIAAADVDGKKGITPSDARLILRVAAKLDSFDNEFKYEDMLVEDGVLHVAVCANNPPFCYTEKGQIKGVDIEIAQMIANANGLKLEIHNMSKDSFETTIKNNKCDIIISSFSNDENLASQGLSSVKLDENVQYIYCESSKQVTVDDLKSKNIGVIKGSVADSILIKDVSSGKLGNANIIRYTRYSDAADALKNNKVFAVIGDNDLYRSRMIKVGTYRHQDIKIAASAEKKGLATNLAANISTDTIQKTIDKYCPPIKSDTSIICETSKITLAPGAVSITELSVDSFYIDSEFIYIVRSDFNAELKEHNGKYYLIVIAPETEKKGTIRIDCGYEDNVTSIISVNVKKSGSTLYNFGKESYCPDFGAYSGVAPYEVILDTENDAIAYMYNAEALYNAGMTETSHYEKYLSLMPKHGFVYDSYNTDNTTYYMEFFANYSLEQAAAYTEYYYNDGNYLYLNTISIIVSHKF